MLYVGRRYLADPEKGAVIIHNGIWDRNHLHRLLHNKTTDQLNYLLHP